MYGGVSQPCNGLQTPADTLRSTAPTSKVIVPPPLFSFDSLRPLLADGASPMVAVVMLTLAVMIIGVAKSGFGGGLNILAVPLVANVVEPAYALGFMLPIMLVADVIAVAQHRHNVAAGPLRRYLLGAAIGVAIAVAGVVMLLLATGAPAGQRLTSPSFEQAMRICVGLCCVVLVLLQAARVFGLPLPPIGATPARDRVAGALSGFTSSLAHSGGPILSIYLLETRMKPRLLVGTLVVFFFLLNLMKLPGYLGLGFITGRTLMLSAVFLAVVPVGSAVGLWLNRRIPHRPFIAIMYAVAGLAGARLLWVAATG